MTRKIKCALIGPGNIGTDLLAKLQRSPVLEPVWMAVSYTHLTLPTNREV